MSVARQCDRCGSLFKPQIGVVTLEVMVDTDSNGGCTNWPEIEFCPSCSIVLLGVIGDSIDDIARTIAKAKAAATKPDVA